MLLALHNDNQLAAKEPHLWLSKRFERSSIAIASSLECSSTRYLKGQFVISQRTLIAILVQETHRDESQVIAISLQMGAMLHFATFDHTTDARIFIIRTFDYHTQLGRLTCCSSDVFAHFVTILIIGDYTNLTRFILHIVPTQAITVQAA